MTTAVAEPVAHGAQRAVARTGGGATLDELVTSAWEDLAVRGHAACPTCGSSLRPADDVPARCHGCGCELA